MWSTIYYGFTLWQFSCYSMTIHIFCRQKIKSFLRFLFKWNERVEIQKLSFTTLGISASLKQQSDKVLVIVDVFKTMKCDGCRTPQG